MQVYKVHLFAYVIIAIDYFWNMAFVCISYNIM